MNTVPTIKCETERIQRDDGREDVVVKIPVMKLKESLPTDKWEKLKKKIAKAEKEGK